MFRGTALRVPGAVLPGALCCLLVRCCAWTTALFAFVNLLPLTHLNRIIRLITRQTAHHCLPDRHPNRALHPLFPVFILLPLTHFIRIVRLATRPTALYCLPDRHPNRVLHSLFTVLILLPLTHHNRIVHLVTRQTAHRCFPDRHPNRALHPLFTVFIRLPLTHLIRIVRLATRCPRLPHIPGAVPGASPSLSLSGVPPRDTSSPPGVLWAARRRHRLAPHAVLASSVGPRHPQPRVLSCTSPGAPRPKPRVLSCTSPGAPRPQPRVLSCTSPGAPCPQCRSVLCSSVTAGMSSSPFSNHVITHSKLCTKVLCCNKVVEQRINLSHSGIREHSVFPGRRGRELRFRIPSPVGTFSRDGSARSYRTSALI
ncbi:uncharacterized protein LOC134528631 [Bacillus rossius redtenbacheri]|uniref:uncharacterized protein LOC134528631 n=1 Tax=Bacillus rossius redtenbacheri TaxID=93214 RepID=UPI002FDD8BD5